MTSNRAPRRRLFPRALATPDRRTIDAVLDRFPEHLVDLLAAAGTAIVSLAPHERYVDASAGLRRVGLDVDSWPVPPAGLYVVEDRALYLRRTTPMTVAHELGHALDCALGGGVYASGVDPRIRGAFAAARRFVTPYAATALDEYMAEGIRAYCNVNEPTSPWPPATRDRLERVDPALHAIISAIFEDPAHVCRRFSVPAPPVCGARAIAACQ